MKEIFGLLRNAAYPDQLTYQLHDLAPTQSPSLKVRGNFDQLTAILPRVSPVLRWMVNEQAREVFC